ncbi:unnamed protein product, partial [Rotaria sp. Silwood1]
MAEHFEQSQYFVVFFLFEKHDDLSRIICP